MFRNLFYPLIVIVFALCLFSCRIVKPTAYFETLNKDTTIAQFVTKDLESKIVKNDVLEISVSSLNKQEDDYYNSSSLSTSSSSGNSSTTSSASISRGEGYTVDLDGNIEVHNLGRIHVEGMTRRQLKDTLETSLSPYLKDPIITVNFSNRRITVLGEVVKPQIIQLQEEKISLLDILALSGDVTPIALKRDILVVRTSPKGKTFKHVNLQNESVFRDSTWYNLQAGDIVYVEPDLKKLISEARITRAQQDLSIASIAISLTILFIELSR